MSRYFDSIENRYERDPDFHQLVRVIEQQLENMQFTPTEVREAAMYAIIRFEAYHHRTFPPIERISHEDFINRYGPPPCLCDTCRGTKPHPLAKSGPDAG